MPTIFGRLVGNQKTLPTLHIYFAPKVRIIKECDLNLMSRFLVGHPGPFLAHHLRPFGGQPKDVGWLH
ncbi:MAG: hypothetical protein DRR19_19275 [Candidatus Parabeggiatoa sp. nov. 1]|nr:MAG: hypothetical protein DRR19_19275 [Gammaproteobacteria bacterium]